MPRFQHTNTLSPVARKACRAASGPRCDRDRAIAVDSSITSCDWQRASGEPAAQDRHQRQPVDRVSAGQQQRGRQGGCGGSAGRDHADGGELRCPGEHQQGHRAGLSGAQPGRDAEHAEGHPVGAGGDARSRVAVRTVARRSPAVTVSRRSRSSSDRSRTVTGYHAAMVSEQDVRARWSP